MLPCLINNKVCSNTNKRCRDCVFDECKEVIKMEEEIQKYEDKYNLECLKRDLPEECQQCSFLEVINAKTKKVYCPYMLKDKCLIDQYVNIGDNDMKK